MGRQLQRLTPVDSAALLLLLPQQKPLLQPPPQHLSPSPFAACHPWGVSTPPPDFLLNAAFGPQTRKLPTGCSMPGEISRQKRTDKLIDMKSLGCVRMHEDTCTSGHSNTSMQQKEQQMLLLPMLFALQLLLKQQKLYLQLQQLGLTFARVVDWLWLRLD